MFSGRDQAKEDVATFIGRKICWDNRGPDSRSIDKINEIKLCGNWLKLYVRNVFRISPKIPSFYMRDFSLRKKYVL
ncbi:hypothetical protein CSE16_12120 [Solibacillus sp. R5-41]|nr:hypothetical protein CSE16_12120 [Solibacillus sp. R5-41]